MTAHTITMPKDTYDKAKQMAEDGYGWENIAVRLKVSEQAAKLIVMGKHTVRKAS